MSENMIIWNTLKRPPESALKRISGGRLTGMTDIKPQWRYEAMTELFGPCGDGWKFEIEEVWSDAGSDGQVMAFARVNLFFKLDRNVIGVDSWSDPIPGVGGSMLIAKESAGLHTNDEGFKMAITDALSVAMKFLGVAADIYSGQWTGSKYKDEPTEKPINPDTETYALLRSADSLEMLQDIWKSLTKDQRDSGTLIKNEMKAKLEAK